MLLEENYLLELQKELDEISDGGAEDRVITSRKLLGKTKFFQRLRTQQLKPEEMQFFLVNYKIQNKEVVSLIERFFKVETMEEIIEWGLIDALLTNHKVDDSVNGEMVFSTIENIKSTDPVEDFAKLMKYLSWSPSGIKNRTLTKALVNFVADVLFFNTDRVQNSFNFSEEEYDIDKIDEFAEIVEEIFLLYTQDNYQENTVTWLDSYSSILGSTMRTMNTDKVMSHLFPFLSEEQTKMAVGLLTMPMITTDLLKKVFNKFDFPVKARVVLTMKILAKRRIAPKEFNKVFRYAIFLLETTHDEDLAEFFRETLTKNTSIYYLLREKMLYHHTITDREEGTQLFQKYVPCFYAHSYDSVKKGVLHLAVAFKVKDVVMKPLVKEYLRDYIRFGEIQDVFTCNPNYPSTYPSLEVFETIGHHAYHHFDFSYDKNTEQMSEVFWKYINTDYFYSEGIMTWEMANDLKTLSEYEGTAHNIEYIVSKMNVKNLGAERIVAAFELLVAKQLQSGNGEIPFLWESCTTGSNRIDYGLLGIKFWSQVEPSFLEYFIHLIPLYPYTHIPNVSQGAIKTLIRYTKVRNTWNRRDAEGLLKMIKSLKNIPTEERAELIAKTLKENNGHITGFVDGMKVHRGITPEEFGDKDLTVGILNKKLGGIQ